jgi:hypothetical protein
MAWRRVSDCWSAATFFSIVGLESKIKLVLGIACSLGVAYSLIVGNLGTAATCAIGGFCVLVSYRREKQLERRP